MTKQLLLLLTLVFCAACSRSNDAHYSQLEQNRNQQATQQPAPTAAVPSPSPSPSIAASPGETAAAPAAPSRNGWTNFRGARRDGKYDEGSVSTNWPANGLRQLWKQPVGLGHASFVVADGKAYTIEQRRSQEVVAAYDINNGHELWTQKWNAQFTESTGDGPRATPTWDQGRIYALGATGELRALDAGSGSVIWGKNILNDNAAKNLQWAMAASPLIVDDKVIVLPGGANGKSVVAYNKNTGATVWKVLDDPQAYVSPMQDVVRSLLSARIALWDSRLRMVRCCGVTHGTPTWESTSHNRSSSIEIVSSFRPVMVRAPRWLK
jgi:outer membrane protein assembly factor BamB